jgi:hypothetical protein
VIVKKLSILFILFLYHFSLAQDPKNQLTYIAPSDARIHYTGRIDFDNPNAPVFYWPGTYLTARFLGTSLTITLNDETGDNFYNVFIDGDLDNPIIIDCEKGTQDYIISENLVDAEHTVQLFRRTEGFSGPTTFLGFVLDVNKKLEQPPPRPPRKIEFYGDSITCGMGNEAPDDAPDDDNSQRNNFLAYGAITARQLNADYQCIAKSGIGIMISQFDMIMPDYYDRLDPSDMTSRWDFSRWTPDVVVINLFQNDSWLIDRLDPVPGESEIVAAYMDFLSSIRSHYPEAHIFCTLGSMDATKEGSPWPGYVKSAVEKFSRQHNDAKVYTTFFEFDGFNKHPRLRHHQKNAEQLTAFIKEKVGW